MFIFDRKKKPRAFPTTQAISLLKPEHQNTFSSGKLDNNFLSSPLAEPDNIPLSSYQTTINKQAGLMKDPISLVSYLHVNLL